MTETFCSAKYVLRALNKVTMIVEYLTSQIRKKPLEKERVSSDSCGPSIGLVSVSLLGYWKEDSVMSYTIQ